MENLGEIDMTIVAESAGIVDSIGVVVGTDTVRVAVETAGVVGSVERFFQLDYLILLPILLAIIGYFRFLYDNKKSDIFFNANDVNNSWLESKDWKSRLTPLFSVFALIYNFFAWGISGVIAIFNFIAFIVVNILKFIKWFYKQIILWIWNNIILWIWYEIINPTLIFLIKIIWHYPIVFIWKFILFTLLLISPSFSKNNLKLAFLSLIKFTLASSFVWILYSMFNCIVIPVIGGGILVFFLQYLIFNSASSMRSDKYKKEFVKPSLKINLIWVGISIISIGIVFAIKQFASNDAVDGLSVIVSPMLSVGGLILLLMFLLSFSYLAPFAHYSDGKFNIIAFITNIFKRLPKLIYAQPFHLLGLAVVAIIPFVLAFLLVSIVPYTGERDYEVWSEEIVGLPSHMPEILDFNEDIVELDSTKINLDNRFVIDVDANKVAVSQKDAELNKLIKLRNLITNTSILTFSGDAYVGEKQTFCIATIVNSSSYKWEVVDLDNDNVVYKQVSAAKTNVDDEDIAQLFKYTWPKSGSYKVQVTPQNSCGGNNVISVDVNVLGIKPAISAPSGQETVCSGDKVTYITSAGYDRYEWELPEGAEIENNNKNKVSILWGENSGTVRVRGIKKDDSESLWTGALVVVPTPAGEKTVEVAKIEDEQNPTISHSFLYYSIQVAEEDIANVEAEKSILVSNGEKLVVNHDASGKVIFDRQEELRESIYDKIILIIGIALALIGFSILFSLALITVWTYCIAFSFDIFGFEQDGKHYWEKLIETLKQRNKNQPLFGWFMLMVAFAIIAVVMMLTQGVS